MRIKPMRDIRIRTKLMALGAVCVLGLLILERESVFTASRIKQAGDETSDIWINAVIAAEDQGEPSCSYHRSRTDGSAGAGDETDPGGD